MTLEIPKAEIKTRAFSSYIYGMYSYFEGLISIHYIRPLTDLNTPHPPFPPRQPAHGLYKLFIMCRVVWSSIHYYSYSSKTNVIWENSSIICETSMFVSLHCESISSSKSLMRISKRVGNKTHPCLTPDLMSN